MRRLALSLVALVALLLLGEGGLRVAGLGPAPRINRFHPTLGWEKTPDRTSRRKTSEYDATFSINARGLRGRDLPYEKPAGTARLAFAGDSFCLGYTVNEEDLFVEILARRLRSEGRSVEVVNGGTEGYSTDQEALWFRDEGLRYDPDAALLCFYPNDVFWCGEARYLRYPKPLLDESGRPANLPLEEPAPESWFSRATALGNLLGKFGGPRPPSFRPRGGSRAMPSEFGVYLREEPEFFAKAWTRVAAAARLFEETARRAGVRAFAVPLPDKTEIHADAREAFGRSFGLAPGAWDPGLPNRRFVSICAAANLPVLDPLDAFRAAAATGKRLFFEKDWHFDPEGNRVLAAFLHERLDAAGALPPAAPSLAGTVSTETADSEGRGVPAWAILVGALWILLSSAYVVSYRNERAWLAPFKVGALLAVVAGVVAGVRAFAPAWLGIVAVAALLGFVVWKAGPRLSTVAELVAAFARRGHWYALPLLVVLVSIGTLLVVAASSPFVAPFIYTLF